MTTHRTPKHTAHLNAPFARQLGRMVRANIDEHNPDDAKGTQVAALGVYDIVEWHAMRVAKAMGIDDGEFAIQLYQAIATDTDDLDRIATRAEQDAEDAEYGRLRAGLHLTGGTPEKGGPSNGPTSDEASSPAPAKR